MLLLEGGRVVCPATGRDERADVLVDGERVVAVGPGLRPGADCEVLDCRGAAVLPGFVDLVCDVADPGSTWREDLRSASQSAAAGGFTTVLASPATDPVIDSGATAAGVVEAAREAPAARILRAGALTVGLAGRELAEMGSMLEEGCAALSDGGRATEDSEVLRHALAYAAPFEALIVLRPAEPSLERRGCMHEGRVSVEIGLRGLPAASEELGVARLVALARMTGARVHLSHVTTARSVELVEAARAEGLSISASVPARSLVLTDEAVRDSVYDTATRLLPPLRPDSDRRALIEGLRAGVVSAICSDHQPWTRVDKELEFERATPGSTGLETAWAAACTALDGDLPLLSKVLSLHPGRALGLDPRVAPGAVADLAIVDPDAAVEVGAPRCSRSANEALRGRRLRGAIRATLVGGRLLPARPPASW